MEGLDLLVGRPCGETLRRTPALGCREGVPSLGSIVFALCLLENKICRGLRNAGAAAALPRVCYRRKKPHGEAGSRPVQEVPQPSPLQGDAAQRLGQGMESIFVRQSPSCWSCTAGSGWERWLHRYPASSGHQRASLPAARMTVATTGESHWRCQKWRGSIRSNPWKPSWDIHPS